MVAVPLHDLVEELRARERKTVGEAIEDTRCSSARSYELALNMLIYGLGKIGHTQFPFPPPGRLAETFGDASPMGLLWTFMGYSTGYNIFGGAAEAIGGVLLFLRRTTTLGALILIGVLSNVVALNFCYDVSVKIGSVHLLAMAFFLAAPDLHRLVSVLVLNRPAPAVDLAWPAAPTWRRRARVALKVVVVGALLFTAGNA